MALRHPVISASPFRFPCSCFSCSIGFFQDEYPDNKNGISFYLTAAYTYPQVPLLLLMVKYGGRFSFNVRILSCLVIQAVCMAGLPLLASTSVWTTLSIVFVIGVTTAILQSSLFGLARLVAASPVAACCLFPSFFFRSLLPR